MLEDSLERENVLEVGLLLAESDERGVNIRTGRQVFLYLVYEQRLSTQEVELLFADGRNFEGE